MCADRRREISTRADGNLVGTISVTFFKRYTTIVEPTVGTRVNSETFRPSSGAAVGSADEISAADGSPSVGTAQLHARMLPTRVVVSDAAKIMLATGSRAK